MRIARTVPCSRCRRPRPQSGSITPGSVCVLCHRERQALHPKKGKKPPPQSHFQTEQAVDRVGRYPTSSWWATSSREQFNLNLAAQMERLRAIGVGKASQVVLE